ncbi:hypothetical protein OIV19_21550 [Brucella sp. HL-2]|nr:hypothetical protein [Brucella sp. HL-2]MCV9910184.1 hypothetical protein [Brucella sp. HL-2]
MAGTGLISGAVINAIVINDGAVIHTLSGTATSHTSQSATVVRRVRVDGAISIALAGGANTTRRTAAPGIASMIFVHAVNASQRHSLRTSSKLSVSATGAATRRAVMGAAGKVRFHHTVASHARRSAVADGRISFSKASANVRRRQVAQGIAAIRLLHLVNLRAFAPIRGADKMRTKESATAVRRVGLPSSGRINLTGYAFVTARRTISTVSVITFKEQVKVPHVRMVPTEQLRTMDLLADPRSVRVPREPSGMIVRRDHRHIEVPQDRDSMNTPRFEDPT